MSNYRVIVEGNSGDGFLFRIEDVYESNAYSPVNMNPFVQHVQGLCSDSSIEGLKETLNEMLEACDKPALCFKQELKEWG